MHELHPQYHILKARQERLLQRKKLLRRERESVRLRPKLLPLNQLKTTNEVS